MQIKSEQRDLVRFMKKILDDSLSEQRLLNLYDGKCYIEGEVVRGLLDFYSGDFEGAVSSDVILPLLEFGFDQIEVLMSDDKMSCRALVSGVVRGAFVSSVFDVRKWSHSLDLNKFKGFELDRKFFSRVSKVFAGSKQDAVNFFGLDRNGNLIVVDAAKVLLRGKFSRDSNYEFFPLTLCDLVLSLPENTSLSYFHDVGAYFFSDKRGLLFQAAYRYTDDLIKRVLDMVEGFIKDFTVLAKVDGSILARSLKLVSGIEDSNVCDIIVDKRRSVLTVKGVGGHVLVPAKVDKNAKKLNLSFAVQPVYDFMSDLGEVTILVSENVFCVDDGYMRLIMAFHSRVAEKGEKEEEEEEKAESGTIS
jgi:hypothetical protein